MTPSSFFEHLRQYAGHGQAARQRMAMLAVGGDDGILWLERLHHTHRHGLLTVVQVQEAADLLFLIELATALFSYNFV